MHRYNGVDLPDKPQYDEAASPCAIIVLLPHGYVFEVLSAPLRQETYIGEVSASDVTYSNWNLSADGKSWEVGAESVSAANHSYSLADILWTNRDITDAEGDVLKAASTPIWLMDMYSFKVGLALALALPPRPLAPVKEPIGYLYGHIAKEGETATHTIDGVGYVGAVLLDIDTVWTDERQVTHPFAVIDINYTGEYLLLCKTKPYYTAGKVYTEGSSLLYWHPSGYWKSLGETSDRGPFDVTKYEFVWTSHDILHTDSTDIFLAAADCVCIPIYE